MERIDEGPALSKVRAITIHRVDPIHAVDPSGLRVDFWSIL